MIRAKFEASEKTGSADAERTREAAQLIIAKTRPERSNDEKSVTSTTSLSRRA
jgi:hypothetical protein